MVNKRIGLPLCFRVVLLAAVAALTGAAVAGDFPSGSYTSGPYTLKFKPDRTFQVVKSGFALVEGEYSVTDQQIQLTDKTGPFACSGPGQATGTYSWKLDEGMLLLRKIEDKCADRSDSFAASPWRKQ